MRARVAWVACLWLVVASPRAVAQQRPLPDVSLTTLCLYTCDPRTDLVRPALRLPDRAPGAGGAQPPLPHRFHGPGVTNDWTYLHDDAAGRLRAFERRFGRTIRTAATYAYDAEGRLTTLTRESSGDPDTTTTFTYSPGSIAENTPTHPDRHRWGVDGQRVVLAESVFGAPDARPRLVSRPLYEHGVFVGEDVDDCRP